MTPADSHETVICKRPHMPRQTIPTEREQFWLSVGCAFATGVPVGMELTRLLQEITAWLT